MRPIASCAHGSFFNYLYFALLISHIQLQLQGDKAYGSSVYLCNVNNFELHKQESKHTDPQPTSTPESVDGGGWHFSRWMRCCLRWRIIPKTWSRGHTYSNFPNRIGELSEIDIRCVVTSVACVPRPALVLELGEFEAAEDHSNLLAMRLQAWEQKACTQKKK